MTYNRYDCIYLGCHAKRHIAGFDPGLNSISWSQVVVPYLFIHPIPVQSEQSVTYIKYYRYIFTGNEDKSLALPRTVVESLSWKSRDAKEIVLQLKQSLQVDHASLEQPDPKTKRLIRYLARKAKHLNRLDVVKHLREIAPAGTAGKHVISYITIHIGPAT